jgi:iron complex transport system ATP-binding protein
VSGAFVPGGLPELNATGLRLGYDGRIVVEHLDLRVPPGQITAIVGANACGKSTLLRALARLLTPREGAVTLDGRSIHAMPTKQVAQQLGILPQSPIAPEGMTVIDLVGRGRAPPVDELSGGQRQRAWIAMAVAQDTAVLLLDEPTTFLDLAHQIDVLDLIVDLNRRERRTIVMVLHDLNHACRYADHMIAMKSGRIAAQGPPADVITEAVVDDVFDLRCQVTIDPVSGTPLVIPIGRHHEPVVQAPVPVDR